MFDVSSLLLVILLTWYMYFHSKISLTNGDDIFCNRLLACRSDDYEFKRCKVNDNYSITFVRISIRQSKSNCTYYQGEPDTYNEHDGVYGYDSSSLWVDKGCQALFLICYKVRNLPETTASRMSSSYLTAAESSMEIGTFHYKSTGTTAPTTFITERVRHDEEHQEDTNKLLIIIVIPGLVLLLIICLVGFFVWRKRRKIKKMSQRKNRPKENKHEAEEKSSKFIYFITDASNKGCHVQRRAYENACIEQHLGIHSGVVPETVPSEDVQATNENIKPCNLGHCHINRNDTVVHGDQGSMLMTNSHNRINVNINRDQKLECDITPVYNCIDLIPNNENIDSINTMTNENVQKKNNDTQNGDDDHIYDDVIPSGVSYTSQRENNHTGPESRTRL